MKTVRFDTLSETDKAAFEAEAGDLLAELGYELSGVPSGP